MITEEMLLTLRKRVAAMISPQRYKHTLGVEKMAEFLARKCLPEKVFDCRAAALLHDITKELTFDEHTDIIRRCEIPLSENELSIPALLHSYTAVAVVKNDFPEFSTDEILSAVEKHTTGDKIMSTLDKIVFLADFIEESRTYPASLTTAEFVKSSMTDDIKTNLSVLDKACVMEIDSMIANLRRIGKAINKKSMEARDSLISKI